jgi:hypothetical protein
MARPKPSATVTPLAETGSFDDEMFAGGTVSPELFDNALTSKAWHQRLANSVAIPGVYLYLGS